MPGKSFLTTTTVHFSSTPMQHARLLIVFLVLVCTSICAYNIYVFEEDRRVLKNDLVELSKIKYGLFNVDEWKNVFSEVLSKKIEELDFNPEQQASARKDITTFLYKAIDDMEERFREEQSQSVGGMVKIGVANLTGMFREIKKNVPNYTDQILTFLSTPANREKVKAYLNEKLSEYTDKTFAKVDYEQRDAILLKYGFENHAQAVTELQIQVATLDLNLKKYLYASFFIALLCALGIFFTPLISNWEYVMYTLVSVCLLGAGLILPMIEIDARIAEMSFSLLGEQVSFSDQILYYKSKSILEVVRMMLSQGKPDVLFVGVLVLLFSVIFPVAKLFTSLVYIFIPSLDKKPFVRFMVFRTGKWSMADVMVIAIFMTYIGFSGILTDQLGQLEELSSSLDILTTNKSSLQDGFFLFTCFVVLSLLVAHRLQFKEKPKNTATLPVKNDDSTPSHEEKTTSEQPEAQEVTEAQKDLKKQEEE